MMKKYWKAIGSGILCIMVVLAVVFGFIKTHLQVQDEQNDNVRTAALPDYNADDNYVILEIVPDAAYKQFGYLQAGSEPVDIFKVSKEGNAKNIAAVAGDGVELVSQITGVQYKTLEAIYGDEKMSNNFVKVVTGAGAYAKQTRYELKSKNDFPLNKNLLQDKFKDLLDDKGVDDIQIVSVTSGDLNSAELSKVKALFKAADVVILNQSYVKEAKSQHQELVQYVSGADGGKTFADNDLDWDVVNTLFTVVSSKKDPGSLIMDSTIYSNALSASGKKVTTNQYKLNREVKYKDGKFNSSYKKVGDDGLFSKTNDVAGSDKSASNNNTYKLFLMSMFRDPIEFYNLFVESELIDDKGKYQLQAGDAATYWNTYTFLPCKGDLAGDGGFSAADSAYWTNEMAIALSLPDNKNYINCNIVSWDTGNTSFIKGITDKHSFTNSVKSDSKDYTLQSLISDELQDYTPKANVDGKTYKVLELQPAKGYDLSPVAIERMIPYTSYSTDSSITLKITKMTTAEFIGRTEDLTSAYDMIYIGNNTDGLWKKDGDTYYGKNNDDMTGVIYAHVGAKVNFNYGSAGHTSSSGASSSNGYALFKEGESGSLRYSGNDITKLKRNELETYLGTKLPVVVASGLCSDAASSSPKLFNFPSYNNMCQFLKYNKAQLMDLDFNYRTASAKALEEQLTRLTITKPAMEVTTVSSSGGSYSGDALKKTVKFTFNSTSADRRITFTYRIEDEGQGEPYTMEFYVDKNADGRFVSTEKVGSRSTRAGSAQSYSFSMNTNYRGAFTWKIVVYPNSNKTLKCSQEGYATISFSDISTGKKVKVLQVQAVKESRAKHATDWGYNKAQQVNLRDDSEFKTLFDQIRSDYDITIDVINLQEFTYGADGSHSNGYWKDSKGDVHSRSGLIQDYDMIIFGFADSYRDLEFNNTSIAKDVDNYIAAGKSVLFTHDLTSQINNTNTQIMNEEDAEKSGKYMEATNGLGFNQWMRDRMGMNRFDQDVRVSSTKASKAYDTMTSGTDKYGFTYTALMQYSNFRRAWSGDVSTINSAVKEKGFYGPYKNLLISLNTNNAGWPDIFSGHYSEQASDENGRTASYSGNTGIQGYGTNYITNVNNGQITSYPFDLSGETSCITSDGRYKIALTHGQYYQLNMEDEEIVCWYALSDQNAKGQGWYSTSPNDVSNNYYIYNKGNVTYSGVGHSNSSAMTSFERKLFVNTIVAALRAGVEGPGATITNGFNVPEGGEDCYVVYADVDVDSEASEWNKNENVEFYLTDDGTDKDKVFAAIEWLQDDGTYKELTHSEMSSMGISIKETSASAAPVATSYTRPTDSSTHQVYKVDKTDESSGNIKGYILKVPRKYLKDQTTRKFRIMVYDDKGAIGYLNGALIRRPMFRLD